jgi:hypothetical protein
MTTFLSWWTSKETDERKVLLWKAMQNREHLLALLRETYEAGQESLPRMTPKQDDKDKRIAQLETALAQLGHNNDRMIAVLRECIPYMKYPSDASKALVRAHDEAVAKAKGLIDDPQAKEKK